MQPDDAVRFAWFAKASLELLLLLGKTPDVLHLHDWQAALAVRSINGSGAMLVCTYTYSRLAQSCLAGRLADAILKVIAIHLCA